jgi:ATP-dependent HslUV protease, peptidase subunit HslV
MLVSFVFLDIFAFLFIVLRELLIDIYIIGLFINKSDSAIEEINLISTYNVMNTAEKWHGTTIVLLRKDGETVVAGDGQVSLGNTVLKSKAKKVRKIETRGVIAGFAGSTADALTLFERLEAKLEKHAGNLQRAAVELAKDWRSDKFLRRLEALMAVADKTHSFIISGTGDVLEPEDGIIGIGSGGNYALAAAKVLIETDMKAEEIARKSIKVASDICVFTNNNITVEKV